MHKPKLTLRTNQVAVYDDFLPKDFYREVFNYINLDEYRIVHANSWKKVWRIQDGFPLRGRTITYQAREDVWPSEDVYPSGKNIDLFIEQLVSLLPEVADLVGNSKNDWNSFSVIPWVYPSGTGLSLHCDAGGYSGAYTYFAHPSWNIHWGGHLLILDPETDVPKTFVNVHDVMEYSHSWLSDELENEKIWEPGFALCILPKPNRITFISSNTYHLISRVDSNAGSNARISIAGFFNEPKST
jgi:hypothetical protein